MIYALIVACEVAFWVVLLAGLVARYSLRRPRLGAALLVGVPLVDLVLLAASALDLRLGGGEADFAHGLAAIYIGVSVAWGHSMVRWADARFAHRFAGAPPPPRPPKSGPQHARHERRQWARHLFAWAVGGALLLGGVVLVGDPDRTGALAAMARAWTVVLAIDFLWSFSYTPLAPQGGLPERAQSRRRRRRFRRSIVSPRFGRTSALGTSSAPRSAGGLPSTRCCADRGGPVEQVYAPFETAGARR